MSGGARRHTTGECHRCDGLSLDGSRSCLARDIVTHSLTTGVCHRPYRSSHGGATSQCPRRTSPSPRRSRARARARGARAARTCLTGRRDAAYALMVVVPRCYFISRERRRHGPISTWRSTARSRVARALSSAMLLLRGSARVAAPRRLRPRRRREHCQMRVRGSCVTGRRDRWLR